MNGLNDKLLPYAKVVVRLLKGDIDYNDKLWKDLLHYEMEIHDFVNSLGLELILNKDDGYALLRQVEIDDKGSTIGLKVRMPLSFEVSVLCVLLRELLDEFESNPTKVSVSEKYITHRDLVEYVELFFKEQRNRKRFLKDIDKHIRTVVDLGFLEKQEKNSEKINDETVYLVKKIIKEKITLDQLAEYRNKLNDYVQSI